jgi:hypothetical protein
MNGGILCDGLTASFKYPNGPVGRYESFKTVVPPNVPKSDIGVDSAVGTELNACISTFAILPNMKSNAAVELSLVRTVPRAISSR